MASGNVRGSNVATSAWRAAVWRYQRISVRSYSAARDSQWRVIDGVRISSGVSWRMCLGNLAVA